MSFFKNSLIAALIRILELQLFLMLVSWPILLHWGIAITPASIIGNCLMGPLISACLILSSLCVLCAACSIPYGALATLLHQTIDWWQWLLNALPCPAAVPLPTPSWWISCLIPISGYGILRYVPKKLRIAAYCIALCAWGAVLTLFVSQRCVVAIPWGSHTLLCIKYKNKTFLIDRGRPRRKQSASRILATQVIPELYKKNGGAPIDGVILLKNSESVMHFYQELGKRIPLKNIYYPDMNRAT